jgi:hypothetical protein
MNLFITITADHNDGNYLTEKLPITPEQLTKIKSILSKMPKNSDNEIEYETRELGDDDKEFSNYNYITFEEKEFKQFPTIRG